MTQRQTGSWNKRTAACGAIAALVVAVSWGTRLTAHDDDDYSHQPDAGRHLFERETFGGNGRTCLTCHSRDTGTVSPEDAQERFARNPHDPLFRGDGTDDGAGNGVLRMLADATVLVRIPLAANVSLASDPAARSIVVRRGIPSTLNTPSLDPVLMYDGRQPSLEQQALGATTDHGQATRTPTAKELEQIAVFERTRPFFSSKALWSFAWTGRAPELPGGRTASEKRGRRFFDDAPIGSGDGGKAGLCAACHSGAMLNETNQFIPAPPFRRGGRFQSVLVSELNEAGNPVFDFLFKNTDGTTTAVSSPDAGRALVTGSTSADSVNAFKIPTLWGVAQTAPYFHDNSAATLEDVVKHYAKFFAIISTPPGGAPGIDVTPQDQKDIVAFLKLLR
jgi:cytochrome c peroxidase